ncbi:NAD-dependent epimerase/dehydratase family protein [Ovoidimarina sediminis]|uniref:NAD-dependent epimerase/dehydratase family protein n=1 Tax=Ovoidimarina sediminis TaxID=3079856 RepID=UPI00290B64BA|nr:NAD(P)-dependent oxidoreductase [Rhodophyticola sp. MJ-SS7]MDU8944067.1 NAD(P)-dependent oxidoreductase [Rhodophyticola sp. MJ-SS7]
MKRLLITGAGGGIGREARGALAPLAETLRLSDVVDLGEAGANEEIVTADIGDAAAVEALMEGVDGVVHLGGVSVEDAIDPILHANVRGVYNLYEAARMHGRRPRIIFASSNHAIGFHPVTERLDADSVPIADSLYGASKVWGEQIALIYWHKFGIESLRIRIGSVFPEPKDRRMLSTWMSYRDFFSLIRRAFMVPALGCPVVYGASDNSAGWWDNSKTGFLGWRPQDSADRWRAEKEDGAPPGDGEDPAVKYQGGGFAKAGIMRTPRTGGG